MLFTTPASPKALPLSSYLKIIIFISEALGIESHILGKCCAPRYIHRPRLIVYIIVIFFFCFLKQVLFT